MESLIIEVANSCSWCLGFTCGTIFWIFVNNAIFKK